MPLSIGAQFWKKVTITKLNRVRDRAIIRSNSGSSSNSGKSVRFSDSGSSIHYTYGSSDYDRGSNEYDEFDIGHYLRTEECGPMIATDQYDHSCSYDNDDTDSLTEEDLIWAEQVRRNTKVNMKRGHHSVAVLIQYRANI